MEQQNITLYDIAFRTTTVTNLAFSEHCGYGWAAIPVATVEECVGHRIVALVQHGGVHHVYLGTGVFRFIGREAQDAGSHYTIVGGENLVRLDARVVQVALECAAQEPRSEVCERNRSFMRWLERLVSQREL